MTSRHNKECGSDFLLQRIQDHHALSFWFLASRFSFVLPREQPLPVALIIHVALSNVPLLGLCAASGSSCCLRSISIPCGLFLRPTRLFHAHGSTLHLRRRQLSETLPVPGALPATRGTLRATTSCGKLPPPLPRSACKCLVTRLFTTLRVRLGFFSSL